MVSKIACARIAEKLGTQFRPNQFGFATRGDAKAGAHAARTFINSNHSSPTVFLKLVYRDPMMLLACPNEPII